MRILELVSIENITKLQRPQAPRELNLHSPATAIFTDFHSHTPIVVNSSSSAIYVEEQMLRTHVKLNIVVDSNGSFTGTISLKELSSDQIIRLVAQGTAREDVLVSDLMISRQQLRAISIEQVNQSSVGDILLTLQDAGIQHCLVVDDATQSICGLISASDVARRLHLPMSTNKAPYFSEIYAVVMHSHDKHRISYV